MFSREEGEMATKRWVKVPGPGEFRGKGRWMELEKVVGMTEADWRFCAANGYLPTHEGEHPPQGFAVVWNDRGCPPKNPPDPTYPKGKDVDLSQPGRASCRVDLPYPAARIGMYVVRCEECGATVGVTTAGRPDDPRSVRVPCRIGEEPRE
jgi:hypothetical protein